MSPGLLPPISPLLKYSRHQVSPTVSVVLIWLKRTSAEELQLLRNFPKTTFPSLNEDSSKAEHFSDSQCNLVGQLSQGVFPQLSDLRVCKLWLLISQDHGVSWIYSSAAPWGWRGTLEGLAWASSILLPRRPWSQAHSSLTLGILSSPAIQKWRLQEGCQADCLDPMAWASLGAVTLPTVPFFTW